MHWFKILLISIYAFDALFVIGNIGKERKPIAPGDAIMNVITSALIIMGILHYF
ncbi:MAG: hypothetical protein HYR95_02375 [Candidatus Colwellbacteria bacterium]|nr:hypothetical protein [Candidatus Colwellbacteria bacterium]